MVYCGALLIDAAEHVDTRSIGDADYEPGTPKWGSARFHRDQLILGVEGDPRTFVFTGDEIDELIMGRMDPKSGEAPAVDLADYKAIENGVSRQHAMIRRKDGSLYLTDLASGNGTYLNGQKLIKNQPRVLRDGDEIRLGLLKMRITYEQVKPT